MFSWICPRCGRENRASDNECANCKLQEAETTAPEAVPVAVPHTVPPETYTEREARLPFAAQAPVEPRPEFPQPPPVRHYAAPVIPDPPPPARVAAALPLETHRPLPSSYTAAPKSGMPTWLLIPLFALAFLGLGALLYFGYQRFGTGKGGFTGGEVPAATQKIRATNPLQKYVEVVGIRLTQDSKKRPQAKFVAVNHGTAELNDLTANVTLWASTSRSEEDSVGTFTFKINSLGANEAKEITTPLKTKLKIYELPDWQNLIAEVQLTSQ